MTQDEVSPLRPGRVCILLPLLNEAGNVEALLDGIALVMQGQPYSVCIVDDGSTDGTLEILARRLEQDQGIVHLIKRKKTVHGSQRGSALHVSLQWALTDPSHTLFVEMDGDLSHRPEELPRGLGLVGSDRCDVAIASKYLPNSQVINRSLGRRAVSLICNTLVRALLSPRIHDYSNGYRFYNRRAASIIVAHEIRYGSPIYLTEVMSIWLSCKLRIAEFNTTYVGRNEGLSKLRFIDLVKAALCVFEIAIRHRVVGLKATPHADFAPSGEFAEG